MGRRTDTKPLCRLLADTRMGCGRTHAKPRDGRRENTRVECGCAHTCMERRADAESVRLGWGRGCGWRADACVGRWEDACTPV